MFVRNLLQAGDHVTILPSGVRITLQYDADGALECVYVGHESTRVLHSELLPILLSSREVPSRLSIKGGTSFVFGVLYTGEVYKVEGRLQDSVETVYLNRYVEDPTKFHFFAGHLSSYAMAMSSPVTISRWLKSAGFNILPSYLVPKNLVEENFASMLNLDAYPFAYPRIMGYIIFRNGEFLFETTNVRQIVIKHIEKIVSHEGYIQAELQSYDLGSIVVTYSDVVNYNIHEGSVVFINEDDHVVDCFNFPGQKLVPHSRSITCSYCGSIIDVPSRSTKFTCSNEHCSSVMYSRVERMLSKLGLEPIGIDRFRKYAATIGNVVSLFDIFDIDSYQNIELEVELPKLLDAAVPSTVVARFSDWQIFCSRCNNSLDSVKYYLSNPTKILGDLGLEPAIYRGLTLWLANNENWLDVTGLLDIPNIHVLTTGKRFEGAPIFRGKSIFITGKFAHGSVDDIKAILTSYSALVYDKFNTAVDCVIIGDFHENTDGKSIQKARQMQIPVFEEKDFFKKYEIDLDIASY